MAVRQEISLFVIRTMRSAVSNPSSIQAKEKKGKWDGEEDDENVFLFCINNVFD